MLFFSILIGGLVLGCTYGILAMGYSLIYQASGYMNFTQPDLLMFGSFLGLTFYGMWGWPFIIALLLSMIIMFIVGRLMEALVIRRLVKAFAKNIYVVLATIALSIIFQNAAMLIWDSRQHPMPSIFPDMESLKIFGASITMESLLCIIVSIVAMVVLHLFLTKTKFGTAMRASAQNKTAASVMGINVWKTIGVTYGISAALATLGGILVSPALSVSMNLGQQIGLKSFASAVIGGYGNIYGAIIGGIIMGLLETFTSAYVSSIAKDFVVYLMLILVMIFKPTGITNAKVYDT